MSKQPVPVTGSGVAPSNAIKSYSKRARVVRENLELYSLAIPMICFLLVFNYRPMYGVIIAFQNYFPGRPFLFATTAERAAGTAISGIVSPTIRWVGLANFKDFWNSIYFGRIITNTIRLSLLGLAFNFWVPIIFALLLNEVRHLGYKKFVQTASYLPYFISMVVVAGMAITFVNPTGLVNIFLGKFGVAPKAYLDNASTYPAIYTIINCWKNFGFGSVLYFSTISAIDVSLYESARIDGGNRWQQCWHITLPGLRFIIMVQFILAIGGLLNGNTDLTILIYKAATYEKSDIIGSFIYRQGIENQKYSYTTAVGLFMSAIGFTLTYAANKASNKITGFGLW